MPISITSNATAAVAQRNLTTSSQEAQRSIAKISSGTRVYNAKEDAGALSVGAGLEKETMALRAASINAQSGISLMQIADGALAEMTEILSRMDTLTVQSMSGQLSAEERAYLDVEFQNLKDEVDRISNTTEFNGTSLLGGVDQIQLNNLGVNVDSDNGFVGFEFQNAVDPSSIFQVDYNAIGGVLTLTNQTTSQVQTIAVQTPDVGRLNEYNFHQVGVTITLNSDFDGTTDIIHAGADEEFTVQASATAVANVYEFQLGGTTDASDRLTVNLPLINIDQLGLTTANVLTVGDAAQSKDLVQAAIKVVGSARATLGANMNRMELAANNIQISIENNEGARSALLDVDVSAEITNITAKQILMEAGTSMLAQANETPRILLGLIQGR